MLQGCLCHSFFPRIARLWNCLPIECFPLPVECYPFLLKKVDPKIIENNSSKQFSTCKYKKNQGR